MARPIDSDLSFPAHVAGAAVPPVVLDRWGPRRRLVTVTVRDDGKIVASDIEASVHVCGGAR